MNWWDREGSWKVFIKGSGNLVFISFWNQMLSILSNTHRPVWQSRVGLQDTQGQESSWLAFQMSSVFHSSSSSVSSFCSGWQTPRERPSPPSGAPAPRPNCGLTHRWVDHHYNTETSLRIHTTSVCGTWYILSVEQEEKVDDSKSNLLQEALGWLGMGDIGVGSVTVGWSVEVTLAAAVMQGDLVISCLVAAPCYTLNTGPLHFWHTVKEAAQARGQTGRLR